MTLLWDNSRAGLEKLTLSVFGGGGRRFLLLFKVGKRTDTQAFDHDCCLAHQRKLLLSDCK